MQSSRWGQWYCWGNFSSSFTWTQSLLHLFFIRTTFNEVILKCNSWAKICKQYPQIVVPLKLHSRKNMHIVLYNTPILRLSDQFHMFINILEILSLASKHPRFIMIQNTDWSKFALGPKISPHTILWVIFADVIICGFHLKKDRKIFCDFNFFAFYKTTDICRN